MGVKKRETNVKVVTLTVFIAIFMTAIEATIVSTAMPTIAGQLKGGEIMSWVFSIYLLTNAMMTPIYGKLVDRVGRKPVFLFGIVVFIIGSSLCGLSGSMLQLIIFRAIQGIGAGAIMPVAMTIIADIYPLDKRAKILGLSSAFWGIASVVGPLCGGFIVDTIGWHWIFFVNVPIGILLVILTMVFLVEPKSEHKKQPVDYAGSLTLMLLLLALLYGFQTLSEPGGASLATYLCFAAVLIFGLLFVKIERKATDPVISLDLFANKTFMIINLIAALVSGFLMGVDVYIPMWMQGVLGLPAALGGMALAPLSFTWVIGSFVAGRLLEKTTTKRALTIGLSIIIIGGIALARVPVTTPFWIFCIISAWTGIGLGITITSTTVKAQSSVDADSIGVATSFNTLCRTLGQTIMISIFGVVLNNHYNKEIAAQSALGLKRDMIDQLSDHESFSQLAADVVEPLRNILYTGLHNVYFVGIILLIVAFIFNQFQKSEHLLK
ncbi:MFS transporter [Vagococcus coleopterorum]|uniref:MFS transporter n=1 Tax=Vagococcus coleopterorum TaxID=2714946 RepID=A0A6G8AM27_9ENTE|nr:MDR family MFS transporter [Vagococcus coleopterorum]QIL46056.1 MFS transporter [Vagococcus coleopterorum]